MKTIAQQLNVTEFPFEIKDKNGKLLYSEYSDGCWGKYEYDSDGNVIYFEDSNGYWKKWEYDLDGNKLYYETSEGIWIKREYDSSGNEIYYEDAYGVILDNRPKEDVVIINGIKYKRIDQ